MDGIESSDHSREWTSSASLDGLSELYEIEAVDDGLKQAQTLGKLLIVKIPLQPFPLEHPLTFYE
jgi:hypothetical protein